MRQACSGEGPLAMSMSGSVARIDRPESACRVPADLIFTHYTPFGGRSSTYVTAAYAMRLMWSSEVSHLAARRMALIRPDTRTGLATKSLKPRSRYRWAGGDDVGGERDDRGGRDGTCGVAQALDRLDAAHAGHVDVHQHDVEVLAGEVEEGFLAGGGLHRVVAERRQDLFDHPQIHRVVVDVQHVQRAPGKGKDCDKGAPEAGAPQGEERCPAVLRSR